MYTIYLNKELNPMPIGETRMPKKWVKDNLINNPLASTHIGQWVKLNNGIEYATTIGRYYQFVKQ